MVRAGGVGVRDGAAGAAGWVWGGWWCGGGGEEVRVAEGAVGGEVGEDLVAEGKGGWGWG